jgi:phosphoribosylanthranilate isomerase
VTSSEATRVWVKVCGITSRRDALAAIEAGADALGFNLWPGSRRCISLEENADWIRELPSGAERIAVLVDAPLDEALRVADNAAIDTVQFHGNESAEYLAEFAKSGHSFVLARRIGESRSPQASALVGTNRILIDANVPGAFGGTGVTVDFGLASEFVKAHPNARVILAGGLTPENVAEAVERVHPFGVDVASGVERNPREKDPERIRAFVEALP